MRRVLVAMAILALTLPVAAQMGQMQHDPDKDVAGGGVKVAGWQARLDRATQKVENLSFAVMGNGFHVTTGPAAIFWKPEQTATGQYSVKATFSLTKMPAHQEAYGLFIGGSNLSADNQKYTYFLIREDGKYLIKKRDGAQTPSVTPDWTDSPAVKKPDAEGKLSNTLSIQVGADSVKFFVNGTEVSSQPKAGIDASGIVGLRINHNLDVHIDGFTVQKQ